MTVTYTSNLRLPIPDFNSEPWHDELEAAIRAVDTAIHDALIAAGVEDWENDHAYAIGDLALDTADGTLWVNSVVHTSPSAPTTFLSFRNANPTYWTSPVRLPTQQGAWTTGTAYIIGDFVVSSNRYAVCIVSHVAGASFDADAALGRWSILIDISNLGVGINTTAVDTIASAATTDLGSKPGTRLTVTGNTTITSFGNTANVYKILTYDSNPIVTHNSTTLALLGGVSRTMRAGDVQWLVSDSVQHWHEIAFFRGDANPATETERGVIELATVAEAQTGTDTQRAVTPQGVKAAVSVYTPSSVTMLFMQPAPPTNWTQVVTHNDKAMRIVSGAGGGAGGVLAFSTVFARTSSDNFTLSTFHMPSHAHGGITGPTTADHTHTDAITGGGGAFAGSGGNGAVNPSGGSTGGQSNDHQHGIGAEGSGGAHAHGMDIRTQYVDIIAATRNA